MTTVLKDNEFVLWSPTYPDIGGNPSANLPAGGSVTYAAETPAVTPLQFTSPDGGTSPDLAEDGRQGVYVRSGALGTSRVTATPVDLPTTFQPESEVFEIQATDPARLGMTVGVPLGEANPAG